MTFTPTFQKRLQEHKAEVARLREEIGDVPEALSSLIRELFDPEALAELSADANQTNGQMTDDDDDYLDGW